MLLFGNKTEALFDIWSLEHFISGVGLSLIFAYLAKITFVESFANNEKSTVLPIRYYFPLFLSLAYCWEAFEFYAEAGYTNIAGVTHWFQGVEHWANRLITDPIMLIIGALIGLRQTKLVVWARCFSIIWLYFHIAVFPDSMYLQRLMIE
jgi:hypothetical protein